jgi:pimeloyl-ACP methyl ester carboxylesterase
MHPIAIRVQGEGIPLVFLHGFCETKDIWENFTAPFSKKYRVIEIDLPGFGESPLPAGEITISKSGDLVWEFLKNMGLSNALVVGHSMGGYMALAMAAKRPEFFKGLVLFHSTALADTIEKKHSRNKAIEFLKKYGAIRFVESFVPALFHQASPDIIAEVVKVASTCSTETLVAYTLAMRDRKAHTGVLESATFPILFIGGEYDTAVPANTLQGQASLPKKSHLRVLPDVGHMGMFEAKEQTQTLISEFLLLCN